MDSFPSLWKLFLKLSKKDCQPSAGSGQNQRNVLWDLFASSGAEDTRLVLLSPKFQKVLQERFGAVLSQTFFQKSVSNVSPKQLNEKVLRKHFPNGEKLKLSFIRPTSKSFGDCAQFAQDLVFSNFVGNKLIDDGFLWTFRQYGCFVASQQNTTASNTASEVVPMSIREHPSGLLSLELFLKHLKHSRDAKSLNKNIEVLKDVIIQVLGFLVCFRRRWDGRHGNLKNSSVFLQTFDREIDVPVMEKVFLRTKHVVRIRNFGKSIFRLNDVWVFDDSLVGLSLDPGGRLDQSDFEFLESLIRALECNTGQIGLTAFNTKGNLDVMETIENVRACGMQRQIEKLFHGRWKNIVSRQREHFIERIMIEQ